MVTQLTTAISSSRDKTASLAAFMNAKTAFMNALMNASLTAFITN